MPAGTQYSKQLNMDLNYVKTPAFYDTNNDEWLMGAAQFVKNASGLWVPVSETNPVPSKLTDSTIPDSQAVPMTQAQKDIVARAVDNILDTIGAENIKLFLPMWETEGTKAYDLLNRDLTFTINGATLGASGPFGRCMSFDGVNDYLIQDPVTENTAGNTDLALNSPTMKAATRMVAIATNPGFVRLRLKRVGTLSVATARVVLYTDNAGVPGTAVANGTSNTLACSQIGTSYENRGFIFSTPPSLQKNQKYWVVLEYADGTGVDASNYIAWQYESGVNTYGEQRAVYDGTTWTATAEENHVFGIYQQIVRSTDCSVLAVFKPTFTAVAAGTIVSFNSTIMPLELLLTTSQDGVLKAYVIIMVAVYSWPTQFAVFTSTLSKAASTDKVKVYLNNNLLEKGSGTADKALVQASPLTIGGGAVTAVGGSLSNWFKGFIGPVIITSNELTATQVAKVSHQLLALRKYGLGV